MSRIWLRWKFWLNGLVLVLPCWYFYNALKPVATESWPEQSVGVFSAQPRPLDNDPPYAFEGQWLKDFSVHLCDACSDQLRQAFLTVGSTAPTLAELEPLEIGILHGSPYGQHVHVPYPATPSDDDRLWLTLQTWDGELVQMAWELR